MSEETSAEANEPEVSAAVTEVAAEPAAPEAAAAEAAVPEAPAAEQPAAPDSAGLAAEQPAEAEQPAVADSAGPAFEAPAEAAADDVETADETDAATDADQPAEADAAADAEPAPEPAPVITLRRQSIVLRSGACDLRVAPGAIDQVGQAAKTVAGKPGSVFLLHGDDVSAETVETCRRYLVDQGFSRVSIHAVPAGRACRTLAQASGIYDELATGNITPDDPIVAVGDADVLSLAIFVGSTWQTGTSVVALPTTLDGMVDVTVTPRAIDANGSSATLLARGNLRYAICDTDLLPGAEDATSLMANAVMVAGAMAAGESNFSDLAIRADGIMGRDAQTLVDEILDITKARTRVASSTALAMRQGVLYGLSMGRALAACLAEQNAEDERFAVETEVCEGRLLAEGLRISARLAAARQAATDESVVDLVFAQDALLDKLGLAEVACNVSAERLIEVLRADELSHSNRFMLALPLGYGRVRLSAVEDDMLSEHLSGWCRARKKLARRRAKAAVAEASASEAPAAAAASEAPAVESEAPAEA